MCLEQKVFCPMHKYLDQKASSHMHKSLDKTNMLSYAKKVLIRKYCVTCMHKSHPIVLYNSIHFSFLHKQHIINSAKIVNLSCKTSFF